MVFYWFNSKIKYRRLSRIINTAVIDTYLNEKSLEGIKDHWIFTSIVEGQYLII